MQPPLTFEAEAERELREAIVWYKSKKPALAERFEAEVHSLVEAISRNPKRFRLVSRMTRQARVTGWPYSIYFTLDEERSSIVVVAVFHGKRNPDDLHRRLE